jgi:HSP20 family protein
MNTTKIKGVWISVLFFIVLSGVRPVFAQETVQDLKKQIDELKAKVAELESHQAAQHPQQDPRQMMPRNSWDPFGEMEEMHQEMNRMFDSAFSQANSPHSGMLSNQMFFDNSEIKDLGSEYQIKLNVDGFDKDKIDIKVSGHAISISGEYKNTQQTSGQQSAFESHSYGKFLNTIPLPNDADTEKMTTQKNGNELLIVFPKKKNAAK